MITMGMALFSLFIAAPALNAQTAEQQEMLRKADILSKYASKQGVFMLDGSLANFKNSTETIYVEIDWSQAKANAAEMNAAGPQAETTVDADRCMAEYDEKFIVFFNANNKKGVQLTTDPNADYKYKMVVAPFTYGFRQMKILGSGTTMVTVTGFVTITDVATNTQTAELFFNTFYSFKTTIGTGGVNEKNTLKCWRAVAEQLDNGLMKLLKKGK